MTRQKINQQETCPCVENLKGPKHISPDKHGINAQYEKTVLKYGRQPPKLKNDKIPKRQTEIANSAGFYVKWLTQPIFSQPGHASRAALRGCAVGWNGGKARPSWSSRKCWYMGGEGSKDRLAEWKTEERKRHRLAQRQEKRTPRGRSSVEKKMDIW